ncbi:MAG: response regulator [Bacteroidota bacterium]
MIPAELEKNERILLLINQDNIILRLTKVFLETEKFTVLSADTGHEAMELFAAHVDRVDLVVCDANILNDHNRKTISRLREMKPDLQIILCANSDEIQGCEDELISSEVVVIMKPYNTLTIIEYAKNFFTYRYS